MLTLLSEFFYDMVLKSPPFHHLWTRWYFLLVISRISVLFSNKVSEMLIFQRPVGDSETLQTYMETEIISKLLQ